VKEEPEKLTILMKGKKLIEFENKKVHLIMPKVYDDELQEILQMHMRAKEL
jgi:hypothetical protein